MMQIATEERSFGCGIDTGKILKPLKSMAAAGIAGLCLMLVSATAFASCGLVAGAKVAGIKLPVLSGAAPHAGDMPGDGDNSSIVGLWHVQYTAGDAVFAVSFKQWHSDGTELDNIDQNPVLGSVCMGVWRQEGPRRVRLHHVGWVFGADGSPQGSFTIDETDTLAEDRNTYNGTFTFRTYDVNGNATGVEVTGNTTATRITVR